MKKIIALSLFFIIIDRVLKSMLLINMNFFDTIEIIKNFFSITLVQNTGAAFSIFSGSRIFLILITIVFLYLIYKYLIKDKKLKTLETLTISILIGGVIGNLIDRIIYGYVIDYLQFTIQNHTFPIFNFADMCIVISVIILIITIIKGDINENRSNKRKH